MSPSSRISVGYICLGLLLSGAQYTNAVISCDTTPTRFPGLNISCSLEHLDAPNTTRPQAKQVIVPLMKFGCHGYVTNWTAHTFHETGDVHLSFIPHVITFQVWRPQSNGQGYSLVGSNALRFSGTALLNGITQIPGQNDMGYFSFNHEVDQKDRIHFAPGDVVGWFMPVSRTEIREPALSVLYVHASELNSSDSNNAVTLYASDAQLESCSVCDIEKVGDGGEIVPGVIPLMVPIVESYPIQGSCEAVVCEDSSDHTSSSFPSKPTTTIKPHSSSVSEAGLCAINRTSPIITILTAALVFVVLALQIVFIGYSVVSFKKLTYIIAEVTEHKTAFSNCGETPRSTAEPCDISPHIGGKQCETRTPLTHDTKGQTIASSHDSVEKQYEFQPTAQPCDSEYVQSQHSHNRTYEAKSCDNTTRSRHDMGRNIELHGNSTYVTAPRYKVETRGANFVVESEIL